MKAPEEKKVCKRGTSVIDDREMARQRYDAKALYVAHKIRNCVDGETTKGIIASSKAKTLETALGRIIDRR